MASTTNFEEWLENGNDPETPEEAYDLWRAANGEGMGIYSVSTKGKQLFITGSGDGTLALVSEKAIEKFSDHIKKYMPHPDLGWEGGNAFHRSMSKDD